MKNKFSEAAAGYGFINFANDQMALTVMHKLNGKMMPNTNPPVRWKLNHSSNRLLPGEKNHSVWVGDLTPEVCILIFSAEKPEFFPGYPLFSNSHLFLV